ncbi:MAG: nitrate/nitrite transporter [Clostridia bacterium]
MKKSTQMILLITNGIAYYATILAAYLHFYYYNLMQEVFNLTNTQIGIYGGIVGGLGIAGYFFSGIIADKFSPKKLLIITYVTQIIILGLYMTIPPFNILLVLQVFATISCVCLYWSAMAKYVRSLGTPEQEARLSGLHFGCVGLGGTVLTLINASFVAAWSSEVALRAIFLLCIVVLILTIVIDVFLYKPRKVEDAEEDKFHFSDILLIAKQPSFWYICCMLLGAHCLLGAVSYFSPLLYANYGVPLAVASILGAFRSYCARAICSPLGGWCIEKVGSSIKFVAILVVIGMIATAAILFVPQTSAFLVVAIAIFAVLVVSSNLIVPAWITPVSEVGIPQRAVGTGIGFYCAIGFSSDCFLYVLGGRWLDTYGDAVGYNYIFGFILIMLFIGLAGALLALRAMKKQKAQMASAESAAK